MEVMQRYKHGGMFLTEAANLSGWDSQVIRPEANLVESIVTDIMGKLMLYRTFSSNFGNLIGMSSHFEQIESLLGMINEDVRIIGLWGMGGIAKTTIAKQFFERFSFEFEGQCLIRDITETCEKRGLSELQKELVIQLLKDGNLNIGTPNIGIPFIRDRLRRMKVLIVLDDISNFEHLELSDGWRDTLGPGSIVMITSRDKQLLMNGSVDRIYEVPELNYNDSLCLFRRHAFKQEHPPEDHHMRLSERAVKYAKGHPLVLKILGSHLNKKNKQEQESALRKLERIPDKYVQKVLRISYDGLDHEEKYLFLNIACLLKGVCVNRVVWFHDARNCSPDIGLVVLKDLKDKSLVTLRACRVWMHDMLKEMGRQIVREESIKEARKRSRLWDEDDICDVLTNNTGTEAIEGISLEMFEQRRHLRINPAAFERMPNLEFLKIECFSSLVSLPHGLDYLPNKLRYLYWQEYPLTYLPTNFHPENLVVLIMRRNHLKRVWNGRPNLVHLKEIDLSFSKKLIEIPDLSWATSLEKLNLNCCCLVNNFQELFVAIKQLTNLRDLYLRGCRRLQSLPQFPMNIKNVNAANCISLERVASPLSIEASGVFDSQDKIWFDFQNCWKLNQNARNNVVANVESRLLHRKTNYRENIEGTYAAATIFFPGGDVPDWFKYKSRGSSLTEKLPSDWCNAELLCLVFCFVVEIKHTTQYLDYRHNFHIRTNGGDRFHGTGGSNMFCSYFFGENIVSNQVILVYNEKLVNDWRKISKGADDADEISIEFYVYDGSRKFDSMPIKCGVHLLYTRDVEDRCCRSVVRPNSPCGDLTQFSLKQDSVDDGEESMTHDPADSEGYNDNRCNAGNLGEDSASIPRRKKMKWKKLNTFNFAKFLGIRRKSTRKVSRKYFKVRKSGIRLQLQSPTEKLATSFPLSKVWTMLRKNELQQGRKGEK